MTKPTGRAKQLGILEDAAERLVTYQLDLLAHLEPQIRAVHNTMRHIERLRARALRVGAELSDGERERELAQLATDIADLDSQIDTEHECCADMQATVIAMRDRLSALRERTSMSTTDESSTQSAIDRRASCPAAGTIRLIL